MNSTAWSASARIVALVGGQQHRLAGFAQLAGDLLVEVHDAVLDVRDENQHVGVLHGDLDLVGDPAVPDVDLAAFAGSIPSPPVSMS